MSVPKLETFLPDVRSELEKAEHVIVKGDFFREIVMRSLWHVFHGDPKSLVSKVREMAAGCGLRFKIDVAVNGEDRVTFWLEAA